MNNNQQRKVDNEKNVGMEVEDIGLLKKKCLEWSPSDKGESGGKINEGKRNNRQPEVIDKMRNSIGNLSNDVVATDMYSVSNNCTYSTNDISEEELLHSTGKFLSESFQVLPADTPSSRAIKASMLLEGREVLKSCGVEQSVRTNCQYCSNPWSSGIFNLKYIEKQLIPKKNMRMNRKGISNRDKSSRRKILHKLVITCSICKKDNITSALTTNFSSSSIKPRQNNYHQNPIWMKKMSSAKREMKEANCIEENNGKIQCTKKNEEDNNNGQPNEDNNNGQPNEDNNNGQPNEDNNNGQPNEDNNNGQPNEDNNNGQPNEDNNKGQPNEDDNNGQPNEDNNNGQPNEDNNNGQPNEDNEKNVGMEVEDIGLLEKKFLEWSPSDKGESGGKINEGKRNNRQPEVINKKGNSIGNLSNDVVATDMHSVSNNCTYSSNDISEEELLHFTGKFLSEAFQVLPADTPSSRAMKAHILSKWRTLSERNGIKRSAKTNCQYCFNPWSNGLFNLKYIESKKSHKEKKLKSLLTRIVKRKYIASQSERKSASLAERKILRKLKKLAGKAVPKLVITCSVCKKENRIRVVSRALSSTSVKSTETNDHEELKCMKKKKKKTDPFAGLNPKYLKNKTRVAVFKGFTKTKMQEANCVKENNDSEKNEGKNNNGQPEEDNEKNVGMELEDIVLLEKKCLEQSPSNKGESGAKKNKGKKNNEQPKVANEKNVGMAAEDLGLLQKKCCKQSTLDKRASGVNNTISNVKNGKIKKKKSKEKDMKGVIKKGVLGECNKKISSLVNFLRNF